MFTIATLALLAAAGSPRLAVAGGTLVVLSLFARLYCAGVFHTAFTPEDRFGPDRATTIVMNMYARLFGAAEDVTKLEPLVTALHLGFASQVSGRMPTLDAAGARVMNRGGEVSRGQCQEFPRTASASEAGNSEA